MPAENFDFDVVTGPSTPREERDDARTQDRPPPPPAGTKPTTQRTG
jgi:hypothetical protein